ncbi:MAG: recombination regulator RecX [Candidatus Dojkabacteria bacterium]
MALITELQVQKRNTNRFNLFVDNKFYGGVSTKTVADNNLYKGKTLTEEELDQLFGIELYNRLFDRAVNYLDKGMRSEFKLKSYIKELIFKKRGDWFAQEYQIDSEEVCSRIASRLTELGLINDLNYARFYVQERIRLKPRSRYAMISELLSKGISKEIAEQVCDELITDEYQLLKEAYYKKYKATPLTKDDSKKISFLQRKGFSWELISQLIDEYDKGE